MWVRLDQEEITVKWFELFTGCWNHVSHLFYQDGCLLGDRPDDGGSKDL
jgi:hypothetical protein